MMYLIQHSEPHEPDEMWEVTGPVEALNPEFALDEADISPSAIGFVWPLAVRADGEQQSWCINELRDNV